MDAYNKFLSKTVPGPPTTDLGIQIVLLHCEAIDASTIQLVDRRRANRLQAAKSIVLLRLKKLKQNQPLRRRNFHTC